MRRIAKNIFITALFLISAPCFSFCQTVSVNDLVQGYSNATEVQKQEVLDKYKYKTIVVGGTIEDVADWAGFDEQADRPSHYYKVTTKQQALGSGSYYQVIIFYKDKNSVDALVKGQPIDVNGALVRIIDEPGLLSLWFYADELTSEDKVMFDAYL